MVPMARPMTMELEFSRVIHKAKPKMKINLSNFSSLIFGSSISIKSLLGFFGNLKILKPKY